MAGGLRYGFKAAAERLSTQIRGELDLTPHDRLDPFHLAAHLGVPTVPLSALRQDGLDDVAITRLVNPNTRFSALTVCDGDNRLIVYNDDHSPERTVSDLAHELSHIIGKHPPRPAIGFGGCRDWDNRYEEEAVWFAGVLLVPRDGAFAVLRSGGSIADGAARFGVTTDLFRWRANVTGINRVLARL